jgi:hypothetical protein
MRLEEGNGDSDSAVRVKKKTTMAHYHWDDVITIRWLHVSCVGWMCLWLAWKLILASNTYLELIRVCVVCSSSKRWIHHAPPAWDRPS